MIVHFSSSARDINKRIKTLRKMCEAITSSGHELARDWLDEAFYASESERSDLNRWKHISQETLKALQLSDAVVIEASIDSFSMGYQAALAWQLKKPLLILRKQSTDGTPLFVDVHDPDKTVELSLIAGQPFHMSALVTYSTIKDAQQKISAFLQTNEITKTDMRFNMFLDRESYLFLKRTAAETGKTRAKIIRDLLHDQNQHD